MLSDVIFYFKTLEIPWNFSRELGLCARESWLAEHPCILCLISTSFTLCFGHLENGAKEDKQTDEFWVLLENLSRGRNSY